MILIIDNYDSFVYNLAQAFGSMGCEVSVVRNDALSVGDAVAMRPDGLVLSPGPCTPREAGISVELVRRAPENLPILGVCLGHQAIAVAFGGAVVRSPRPTHGKRSEVILDGRGLFAGMPRQIGAARYHSLTVDEASLPAALAVTARTADGEVMGIRHAERPVEGVQFHPESYLSPEGPRIIRNFVRLTRAGRQRVGSHAR